MLTATNYLNQAANLAGFIPYPLPTPQMMPTQETGTAPKPSGVC